MVGMILLTTLGVMTLIGLGSAAVRDFRLPALAVVTVFAAVVGLNFIPPFSVGDVSCGYGTALFLAFTLFLLFFRASLKNVIICVVLTVLLTALLCGSVWLCRYYSVPIWNEINIYYGLIVGLIAFAVTRNARYGFVASVLSVTVAAAATGRLPFSVNAVFTPAVVAGGTAAVLFSVASAILPKKPARVSYYFEAGRLLD